jgi:hypothetical protein
MSYTRTVSFWNGFIIGKVKLSLEQYRPVL